MKDIKVAEVSTALREEAKRSLTVGRGTTSTFGDQTNHGVCTADGFLMW
jgi:hypothetical protein